MDSAPEPITRSDSSFDYKTAIVALFCLLGTGAGTYFLYRDFSQQGGAGQGPAMAKVEHREANVRRKAAATFSWTQVRLDENLYRHDSVQTSAGSAAAIRFADGSIIELGENSLVVIDEITNLSLDFMKGSVVLHTLEGDKHIAIGKDGLAKLEELPIRLVKPEPLMSYFTRENERKSVHFTWKDRSARGSNLSALPGSYALEISAARSFREGHVQSVPLQNETLEADATLLPGSYFWRLRAGDKVLTETGQFKIVAALPLKPVGPSGGEKLLSYGEQVPTRFRWIHPDEALLSTQGDYELQVASDAAFRRIVASQPIEPRSDSATVKGLPEGSLYWRIRSRFADLSVLSTSENFTVGHLQKPTLSLVYPEAAKTLGPLPQLRFSWSSDASGLEYRWELQSAAGQDILSSKSTALGNAWKAPQPGVYRWRVSADHLGQTVAETAWRGFSIYEGEKIALISPALGQEIHFWEKPAPFTFTWSSDELIEKHPDYFYQIEVASNPEFKAAQRGPKSRTPSLGSQNIQLPEGDCFWKVHLVNSLGQPIKSSEPSRFAYGVYPLLGAPLGRGPASDTVINLGSQEKNPLASWTEVKDAEGYEVTVYTPDLGSHIAFQTLTSNPQAELKNLKPSHYFWTVRAIDRLKRKGQPMVPRRLEITYGEILEPPQITSSEVQ